MKHDDFIKELRLIDNKRLEPGEQFIAQLQLVMRNYVTDYPLRDMLLVLVNHHGIEHVREALNRLQVEIMMA